MQPDGVTVSVPSHVTSPSEPSDNGTNISPIKKSFALPTLPMVLRGSTEKTVTHLKERDYFLSHIISGKIFFSADLNFAIFFHRSSWMEDKTLVISTHCGSLVLAI